MFLNLPLYLHDSMARIGTTGVVPMRYIVVNECSVRKPVVTKPVVTACQVWTRILTYSKLWKTTKFSEQFVYYAPTIRELVVTMRNEACQCVAVQSRLDRFFHFFRNQTSLIVEC